MSKNYKLFEQVSELFHSDCDEDRIEELKRIFGIFGECKALKANKEKCTLQAKENGYCGKHNPDKKLAEEKKPSSKKLTKKVKDESNEEEEEEEEQPKEDKKKKSSKSKSKKPAEEDEKPTEEDKKPKKKPSKDVEEQSEEHSEEDKKKKKAEDKPKTVKTSKQKPSIEECNYVNSDNDTKCSHIGTIKFREVLYCKRHFDKVTKKVKEEEVEKDEENVSEDVDDAGIAFSDEQ